MERWRGKHALVTGASAGIGFAIAEGLARAGVNVFACARNVSTLEGLAGSLPPNSGKVFPLKADLSKENEIVDLFKTIQTQCGHVDILVNNVGLSLFGGLDSQSTTEWRLMLDVNIMTAAICTKETLKLLDEDKVPSGHIININSAEWDPTYEGLNFCRGTKEMMAALTKALHTELTKKKRKIRVTSICPGLVASSVIDNLTNCFPDITALSCQDVANGVLYVLSVPEHVVITELTMLAQG
ncbi:putative Dehydrogenase/reductase SDR family member 11 [Hypsibius exemplaris]|uniref:Dehydrogenase/reductase SDR family member 11 n=1 Tax=Hypsibius exemplaris TaxID=2072580 RepID=A0A1W0WUE7_HYPEX|nr:putative Dehydrogenase/reductase SDR family member 11 [Hypsibius exemplaris]